MGLKIGKGGQNVRKPTWSADRNELSKRILEKASSGSTSCDPHGNVHTFARLKSGRYTANDLEIPEAVQQQSASSEQASESFAQSASEHNWQTEPDQFAPDPSDQYSYSSEYGQETAAGVQQEVDSYQQSQSCEQAVDGAASNDALRSMFSNESATQASPEPAPVEPPQAVEPPPAAEAAPPKRKTREQKKSAMFNAPTSGAMKSKRGTVEVVFRDGGKTLIPKYNVARVLQSVTSSDGRVFKRNTDGLTWSIFDPYGKQIPSPQIKLAAFDADGNFYYVTADGIKTILKVDGTESSGPVS